MEEKIAPQAYRFQIGGKPVSCKRYGSGHINGTFLLEDSAGAKYILQRINKNVFRDPAALMGNIAAVTEHLRSRTDNPREVLSLVPTEDGKLWLTDAGGETWRVYRFVTGSLSLDKAETPDDFRESGFAFGRFQRLLADFPAHTLTETIVKFHDTPSRFAALRDAIGKDTHHRVRDAGREIEFALGREKYAKTLVALQDSGDLPLRVTHNDTKLNNVLFDRDTRKALCVIDLDTVMPGLSVNDFGDSIRFGASTAAEDERDLRKVSFSPTLYRAYAGGFLSACGESLTRCEIDSLPDGAKMMTLECGVRFLTDYLSGDSYFQTHREGQNLDRCRTQFKLVSEMEGSWDTMKKIIKEVLAE
ncbi:MAG: aminoglycoside phosphotransferase family protein [Oscillospiraceae bacterium]|jgi:Ser/Thr protein kinase RdoA (MazF antagonist)|nr:aminoglycoside phosphotransferase family protein [Oscillospiraceae bacterium]